MSRHVIRAGFCIAAVLLSCGGVLHGAEGVEESGAVLAVSDCLSEECERVGCGDTWDRDTGCGPHWAVTADALFLYRRGPAAAELMFNQADPGQKLNAAEFDFGVGAGFDVSGICNSSGGNGIEVRYFGLDPWNSTQSVATTPGDPIQINTVRPLIVQAGSSIAASCRSDLDNFELNGRRQVNDWMTLLVGFRYLELDERFQAELTAAELPFTYETVTRNRLYGAQFGGQALLWGGCGPLSVEGVGKAGIYGNRAAQDSAFGTGVVTLPAQGARGTTAFVGEVGLSASYGFTERFSVRGGYRLLWVDGVALATDQLAASDFLFASGINATGDAFYHGAFVGLQYGW